MRLSKVSRWFGHRNPGRNTAHQRKQFQPTLELLEQRYVPATHFLLSGLQSSAIAGTSVNISVTAQNADNSTDTLYQGTVQFASSDGRAFLPASGGLSAGVGHFSVTFLTAGSQSITAKDDVNSNILGQASTAVGAAATAQFLVSGLASPHTAGVAANITVTAQDLYGNRTTGYAGLVHFMSSDVQAVLPSDRALTNGTGTFSVTLRTAGTQTLTVIDIANSSITGSLAALPQTTPIFAQAASPSGGGVKSAWFPPNGLDGDQYVWDSFTLGSSQTINEIHWRGFYAYNSYGSPNIPSAPVSDFTISIYPTSPYPGVNEPDIFARPIVQYSVGGNAGEALAGMAGGVPMYDYAFTLPTAFQVTAGTRYWLQIEASQGVAPSTSWPPDWSLANATGGDGSYFMEIVGGTLAGGNLYRSVSGDTTFSLVSYSHAPGVLINPAAMSRLNVTGFPSTTTAGLSGTITVTASDPFGNITPSYAGTVHFTSSDPKAVLPANTALTNGIVSLPVTLESAGTQFLTATDTVNVSLHGSQSGIVVNPADAYSMSMAGFPSAVTVGKPYSLTITLRDFYGNVATGYTGTVAFASTDPQATLPADYTFVAADKGIRSFSATLNTLGAWSLSVHDALTSSLADNLATIQVYPPIALGSLSFGEWTATRGGYSGTIAVSGGAGGYTGLVLTGLPGGLRAAITGSAITLGGTPTTAGTFNFKVSLVDSAGIAATQTYRFIVEPRTTLVWTGLGGDNLWSNAANWSGAAPVAGNILDFGPGALQKTNVNNLAPGTLFSAIVFEDNGYTLKGNAIRLSAGLNAKSAVAGVDSVALNITLTANQRFAVSANNVLQIQGAIRGLGFGITKSGPGNLVYTGTTANTYTGATILNGGVLQLDNSVGNAITGPLTIGAATSLWYGSHDNQVADTAIVSVGPGATFDLNGRSDKVGGLVLTGGAVATGTGVLVLGGNVTSNAASSTSTITGALDLGGLTRTFTVAHGSAAEDLVLAANVSKGAIAKAGAGAMVLSGNNTYAGLTSVNGGVLDVQSSTALGSAAAGTTVAAGATLEVEPATGLSFADALTLGSGAGGATLLMLGGDNTWLGKIATAVASTINVASGRLTLSGVLSGMGAVNKTGAGTLVYGGSAANTLTGKTTVSGGQLQLNDSGGNAISGPLTIGAGGKVLYGNYGNQVGDGSPVTVGAGATFDLNGQSDKIATLVLNGGNVNSGAGTVILGGNIVSNANSTSAIISGNLDMGGQTRTVTVAPGTPVESLVIAANVSNGSLTKAGGGALVLSGVNSYSGPTKVIAGVLDVWSSLALGSTSAGTAVLPGARLEIEGNGLTLNEPLTLGSGTLGASLVSLGGNNVWTGSINLVGTSTVNVGPGQLSLGGAISGAGGLIKTGAGTLLVNSQNNTFAGLATVNAGVLGGTGKLGGVTVNPGAHLAPGSGGGGVLTASNVSLVAGATFDVGINGTSPGADYAQLVSTGSVIVNGASLNLSLGSFVPTTGATFTIVTRTSAGAGNTTFAGLPEGKKFTIGMTTFQITYLGGSGHHDIVLMVL